MNITFIEPFLSKGGKNMNGKFDYLGRYVFSVGEVVTVGGKSNVLAEVLDTSSEEQLKVRILTQPNQGKILYTTRYTYYTKPMPHLTPKDVLEKVNTMFRKPLVSQETPKTMENLSMERKETEEADEKEKSEESKETIKFDMEETEIQTEQLSLF
jgi:hypothetical protein